MPRIKALLSDPVRSEISATLMDAQVLHEDSARLLNDRAARHARMARAVRRAQEHLSHAEMRAEREHWDGQKCRRQADRRVVAA